MSSGDYIQFVLALLFVLGLIGLGAVLLRRFGPGGLAYGRARGGAGRRLHLIETLPLDARHRLVLLRRDDKEHLVLLGHDSDTLIEAGLDVADDPLPVGGAVQEGLARRFDEALRRLNRPKKADAGAQEREDA
jgi:flagellar protein FliO/FliZ